MKILVEDIYEVLSNVINSEIDFKEIERDADLAAYGLTSVTAIQLIILLEQKFTIEFKAEDLLFNKFNTINKLCNLLEPYK